MCTVTWLPLGDQRYILTSNRDEAVLRQALKPAVVNIGRQEVLFPKDPMAGGTWIATSGSKTICLLNGAFKKHRHNPPYRRSRGLVVLDYFTYDSARSFIEKYDFTDIEPFTLVIVEGEQLFEARWDGQKIFFAEQDRNTAAIWASATLYPEEVIEKRRLWFRHWLESEIEPDTDRVMKFHEFAGDGSRENDLVINRNEVLRTVSITSLYLDGQGIMHMKYKDLLDQNIQEYRISRIIDRQL